MNLTDKNQGPGSGLWLPKNTVGNSEHSSIAAWLIQLRWIAVVAQAVAAFIGFKYIFLEPRLIYPFLGTVFFLMLFNVYSVAELRRPRLVAEPFLFGQVAVDTVTLSFLLALSGGTRNPFISLLFIHATLGALLLSGKYRGGFIVILMTCLIALFQTRDWQVLSSDIYVWEFIPLFALLLSLLVSWGLVASLSDTLRATRLNLVKAQSREARINHLLALGALTAEFAHQFATPLNTLRLRISRLARNEKLADQQSDLGAIAQALDSSEKVLREMTTAPLDSTMLTFSEVNIGDYLVEALADWRAANPHVKVSLEDRARRTQRSRIPTKVFAKSLYNLLDNAAAASPDGVEVELSEDADSFFITLMDRGPGWPEQIKTHGIRPHLTTRPGGTGLGLFNCQSLCEVMGGYLEISDRDGGGAIAKLALPKTA